MSQYLTPERLLALAGLPVTEDAIRKLTESVKPTNQGTLIYSGAGERVIRLIDAPNLRTPEQVWAAVDPYLTANAQSFLDMFSDGGEGHPVQPGDDISWATIEPMTLRAYADEHNKNAEEDPENDDAY